MILSGYITNAYGVYPGTCIMAGVVTEVPDRWCSVKEADSRIVPQIAITYQEEIKRVVVMSNDTDFVIYSLAYHRRFCELGIQELWVKFGIKTGRRSLGNNMVERSV